MKDVVSLTQGLFALSKVKPSIVYLSRPSSIPFQDTAKLESEAFVQQQKVALASEVKAVLDSWVRYEQQVKESEQADLTKSVIDKVLATIKDERTQREILVGAITEVERKPTLIYIHPEPYYSLSRTCQEQGYLNVCIVFHNEYIANGL